jgi:hypothetical protein
MTTPTTDVTTDVPEGAFSVEDLLMLNPVERAVVEADMAADLAAKGEPEATVDAPAAVDPAVQAEAAQPTAPAQQPTGPAPHETLAQAQARAKEAESELAALSQKYDEGEITSADWRTQLAAITAKQADALAEIKVAQDQITLSDQAWNDMVRASLGRLNIERQSVELTIYDSILKSVETNYPMVPDAEKVQMAENFFAKHYGGAAPPPAAAPARTSPAAKRPQAHPEDAEALGTVPPNISTIPAGTYDPAQGPFDTVQSVIDQGRVYDAEAAFARMTPQQQEDFLRNG